MWEFRRDPKDLKPEEREALERLFVELPVLKDVYDVRVRFKAIFDTAPDRTTAEKQLAERQEEYIVEVFIRERDRLRVWINFPGRRHTVADELVIPRNDFPWKLFET